MVVVSRQLFLYQTWPVWNYHKTAGAVSFWTPRRDWTEPDHLNSHLTRLRVAVHRIISILRYFRSFQVANRLHRAEIKIMCVPSRVTDNHAVRPVDARDSLLSIPQQYATLTTRLEAVRKFRILMVSTRCLAAVNSGCSIWNVDKARSWKQQSFLRKDLGHLRWRQENYPFLVIKIHFDF